MRPPTYYYVGNPLEGILAFEGEEQDGHVTEVVQSVLLNPNNEPLFELIKGELGKKVFKTAQEARPAYIAIVHTALETFEQKLNGLCETHPERPAVEQLVDQLKYLLHIAINRHVPVRDVTSLRFRRLQQTKPKRPPIMPSTRAEYAKRRGGSTTRWHVELEHGRRIFITALDDVIVSASGEARSIIGHLLTRKLSFYERKGAKVSQVA